MPLPTLNGENINKKVVQKTIHTQNVCLYCFKHYVSGLLDISKKILVVVISFIICNFLDIRHVCYDFKLELYTLSDQIYSLEYLLSKNTAHKRSDERLLQKKGWVIVKQSSPLFENSIYRVELIIGYQTVSIQIIDAEIKQLVNYTF